MDNLKKFTKIIAKSTKIYKKTGKEVKKYIIIGLNSDKVLLKTEINTVIKIKLSTFINAFNNGTFFIEGFQKCECGAVHTSNQNHHFKYCPMYLE